MEEKITYFDNPGKENTKEVLRLVIERAKSRNIRKIVLASTTGYTARLFLDEMESSGIKLIAVPWQFNLREEGNRFPQELIEEFKKKEHTVHFGTMLLSSGLTELYNNSQTTLANILRILGQGMKVCVEIVMMACDGGCIKMGEKIIAVAGSRTGADFALVATAAPSSNIAGLKINEIICKPIL